MTEYTKEQLVAIIRELEKAVDAIEKVYDLLDPNDYNRSGNGYDRFNSQARNYLDGYRAKLGKLCVDEMINETKEEKR